MKGIFSYDNPVMHFIGKFWDVLVLNILWLICSIPIFTIGASTTAVYYVTLKLARDDDGYTIRSFFHSFKQNFRQATIIWLILLGAGIILFADLWFVLTANIVPAGTMRMLAAALFLGLLVVWFAVLTYVFPVLARFYGTVKQTLTNAFLLSVRYILYTIGIVVMDLIIVVATVTALPVLTMLGVALIAFVNSFFLEHIFKKLIPKDERDIHDMRPLFEDEAEDDGQEASYRMFMRGSDDGAADAAESGDAAGSALTDGAGGAEAAGAAQADDAARSALMAGAEDADVADAQNGTADRAEVLGLAQTDDAGAGEAADAGTEETTDAEDRRDD